MAVAAGTVRGLPAAFPEPLHHWASWGSVRSVGRSLLPLQGTWATEERRIITRGQGCPEILHVCGNTHTPIFLTLHTPLSAQADNGTTPRGPGPAFTLLLAHRGRGTGGGRIKGSA